MSAPDRGEGASGAAVTPTVWMYEGGDLAPGRHFIPWRQPALEGNGVMVTPLFAANTLREAMEKAMADLGYRMLAPAEVHAMLNAAFARQSEIAFVRPRARTAKATGESSMSASVELWRAVPKAGHLHGDVLTADGRVVCSALPRDARLIAEAPMMLDEIRKSADTFAELAQMFRLFGYPLAGEACRVAEQSNRDAIAKAEGDAA